MAASQSTALKHWARIIQRWPIDKVRPANVSFQTIMQQRLQKAVAPPAQTSGTANDVPIDATHLESSQLQQVNALYSLLENRFQKQYPVPQALRYPASNPSYYDDVVRELEEAPSRSWLGAFTKRVKGALRFS